MKKLITLLLALCLLFSCSCGFDTAAPESITEAAVVTLEDIPEYSGEPYIAVDGGIAGFSPDEITAVSFERYDGLDIYGRCTQAFACLGRDLMPTTKRGDISAVKPSGWRSVLFDFVDGQSLYNRCHLIGHQLSGEDANERNLITGTRYMNTQGMLPFENMTADYIRETGNHVMYRVIPVFRGTDLVASGVLMEGYSVEDSGEGINFRVYCYNVQPGVDIDYSDGAAVLSENESATAKPYEKKQTYILNEAKKKIHLPDCASVDAMLPENKRTYIGTKSELLEQGYTPCGECRP